ncbi:hypothetical protein HYQ46_009478 [Verticillium longisporum]|nr:hypothetical protein HYQ46_009478 [Verticillium longisporum]
MTLDSRLLLVPSSQSTFDSCLSIAIVVIIIIIIIILQRFVVCLPSDSTTSSLIKQIDSDHRHQDQDWYTRRQSRTQQPPPSNPPTPLHLNQPKRLRLRDGNNTPSLSGICVAGILPLFDSRCHGPLPLLPRYPLSALSIS